jgi:hypothetical protein
VEVWKRRREVLKRDAKTKNELDKLKEWLEGLGPEPAPPLAPDLLIDDVTPEFIIEFLANHRPYSGILSSEGGSLLGGAGFNEDRKVRMASLLSKIWDGQSVRKGRASTGKTFIPNPRLAIHLMLQPVLSDMLLTDPVLQGQGFCSRLLMSFPSSTIGTRLWSKDEPTSRTSRGLEDYHLKIYKALCEQPVIGDSGELVFKSIAFTPPATDLFIEFYNNVERNLSITNGGKYATIHAFGSKMPEHAARLAALLAIYQAPRSQIGDPLIEENTMKAATRLVVYYAEEVLRLTEFVSVNRDLKLARRLGSGCAGNIKTRG